MNDYSFFSHHRINDHIYIVRESFGYDNMIPNSYFFIGVVIGQNKVAVIDSGNGATPALRSYIEENITGEKPMVNLLTHNHLDHIGACMMFDERYMHPIDINADQIAWATDVNRHFMSPLSDMAVFCQSNPEVMAYCQEHYYKNFPTVDDFKPINDGDVIDIGGVEIEVYHTPGHSEGSCCYYIRGDHFVFSGDAISPSGMSLRGSAYDEENSIIAYLKRAKKAWAKDTMICDGHNFLWGMDLVDKLLTAFEEVKKGVNLQNDVIAPPSPFRYDDGKHTKPKVSGTINMRHFYKNINVNYTVKVQ